VCDKCGCGTTHDHGHDHAHGHDNGHDHVHGTPLSQTLIVERKILSRNDELADKNRDWLADHGVTTLNLISAPGTGKTSLLEATLDALHGRVPCAVITGDQRTDNDARRLQGKGAKVTQIETVSACHLDAERVGQLLRDVIDNKAKLLFIENVGNLVCPAAFDLGESFKVALMSVTEGEDKPLKYPSLFTQAPVVVLTKTDLIPHLDWDMDACRDNLRRVHPGVFVFELSARTGKGMDAWIDYMMKLVA